MPWFNSLLPGFDSETAKAFEVVGIPKPVLVGPDGHIIAIGEDLRGARLLDTLAKVFNVTLSVRARTLPPLRIAATPREPAGE